MLAKGADKAILQSYFPIVDAIQTLFGDRCEVVLHDLSDPGNSIIHIQGNLTKRKIGAPVTEVLLQKLKLAQEGQGDSSYYLTKQVSDRVFKSSTTFIRNEKGRIIGCLCINYDITDLKNAADLLTSLVYSTQPLPEMNKKYHENSKSLVQQMIDETIQQTNIDPNNMTREDKLRLVALLDEKGAFEIQKGVVCVADFLGVTRITIYNYLKEINRKSNPKLGGELHA